VHLLGVSSVVNSVNVLGTLVCCRRRYYGFGVLVLFLWGVLLTGLLLVLCLPILAGGLTMVLFDRNFNTCYYDVLGGGDLVLFQHLFWFFGHPEVYVIILPMFGFCSSLLECVGCRCVFMGVAMIYAMVSISFLGFFVWVHHMFIVGLDLDARVYFGMVTLVIGVPTCIKVFNWLYSVWCFDLLLLCEVWFVYLFVFMFLLGGITGLVLANVGLDVLLHDTYFVVAHFHYVLSLGAVVAVFGGVFHFLVLWLPCEFVYGGVFVLFYGFFFGSNFVFFPLHSVGLYVFPRRVSDYPFCYCLFVLVTVFGLVFLWGVVFFGLFGFCGGCLLFYVFLFVVCGFVVLGWFFWVFVLVACLLFVLWGVV